MKSLRITAGASPAGGQRGKAPPIFVFVPPRYFFGRKKLLFFGQKKPSDFGEDLFFFDFGLKKPSDFGEDLFFFFGDHLLLVGKFMISARKSLRISAKTFAPLISILPPRSREAGDAPELPVVG